MLLPSLLHISCKEHEIFHHLYFKYPLLSQRRADNGGKMLTPVCSGTACNGKLKRSFNLLDNHRSRLIGNPHIKDTQRVILNYVITAGFLSVNV